MIAAARPSTVVFENPAKRMAVRQPEANSFQNRRWRQERSKPLGEAHSVASQVVLLEIPSRQQIIKQVVGDQSDVPGPIKRTDNDLEPNRRRTGRLHHPLGGTRGDPEPLPAYCLTVSPSGVRLSPDAV